MKADQLRANAVVQGSIFPEPVQVIVTIPMGDAIKLVGKGLNSGKVYEPILPASKIEELEASPSEEPFDGDPQRFRLRRLCPWPRARLHDGDAATPLCV